MGTMGAKGGRGGTWGGRGGLRGAEEDQGGLLGRSSQSFFGEIQWEPFWADPVRLFSGEIQSERFWGDPVRAFSGRSSRSVFGEKKNQREKDLRKAC